jgi:hypothetical protein
VNRALAVELAELFDLKTSRHVALFLGGGIVPALALGAFKYD